MVLQQIGVAAHQPKANTVEQDIAMLAGTANVNVADIRHIGQRAYHGFDANTKITAVAQVRDIRTPQVSKNICP